jgi:integrase
MRVFKTTYKDRKGRTQEAARWYVEFRDHLETVRRLPAFASKAASEEMGRNLDKLVAYHKASGGQIDPALARWITGLATATKAKLFKIGLLDRERAGAAKLLTVHLDDWAQALRSKGTSEFHIDVVTGRARRILTGCEFKHYADIQASKVQAFLNDLRSDTTARRGISAQTFNFYLSALKQFCRWMMKDRRAAESPVAHLDGLNVRTDRRRDRRAFTLRELRRLLESTAAGPDRAGMHGRERALLYRTATETGLRANELRSLTRSSFDLDAAQPTVTVEAGYSKHRRQDVLPLRPALVAALLEFLANKLPNAPAFRMPKGRKESSRMFQADLEAAGIVYRDDDGLYADFHALRHTFITNLANGGVHPKTAQALARHSTITLTMDRYSHSLMGEQAEALDVLPDLDCPAMEALRATGTAGRESVLASCLAHSNGPVGTLVDSNGQPGREAVQCGSDAKTVIPTEFLPLGSVCTSGGGPGLQNQWGV